MDIIESAGYVANLVPEYEKGVSVLPEQGRPRFGLPNDYSSFSRAFIERLIRLRPISTSMTLTLTG